MEVLRDEICRMICDHNGETEFLFSRSSIPKHTLMLRSRLTLSLCVGLANTLHLLSWARGEAYSPSTEVQLAFTRFRNVTKATDNQGVWCIWEA